MLSLKSIDERTVSYLRGMYIFSSILKANEETLKIWDVQFTPGHFGLKIANRTLCIFDAVPSSHLIKEAEQQRIFQQLKNGEIATKIDEVGGSENKCFFIFNVPVTESPITKFSFINDEKLNQLRLLVVQENGALSAWRWISTLQEREVYRWKFISKIQLSEENLVKIIDFSYSLDYGTVFWWENDVNIESSVHDSKKIKTQLMMRKFNDKKRQFPERIRFHKLSFRGEESNNNKKIVNANDFFETVVVEREDNINPFGKLVEGFTNISKFVASHSGLWIITEMGLGYWGYGAELIVHTPILSKNDKDEIINEIEEYYVTSDDVRTNLNSLDAILSNKINDDHLPSSSINNSNSSNNSNNNQDNNSNNNNNNNLKNLIGMKKVIRKRTSIVGPVIDLFLNYQTRDLMLLESSGRVLICVYATVPKQGILTYHLCTLEEHCFDFNDFQKAVTFYHYIIVLTSKMYFTFDIKTGSLINSQNFPDNFQFQMIHHNHHNHNNHNNDVEICFANVWQSSRDLGIWSSLNGIYQFIYPQISEQLNYLSQNLTTIPSSNPFASKFNYPSVIASQWMLDHYHAKYSLDELYQSSKNVNEDHSSPKLIEHQQNVSNELLPHLQNPALVLALLQNMMHRPFLDREVDNFIQKFNGGLTSNNGQRIAQRESYHLHTPLNQALLHLFEQYKNLSDVQKQLGIGKSDNPQLESISPPFLSDVEVSLRLLNSGDIWKIERSKFETLLLTHPHHCIDRLEDILHLKPYLYPDNQKMSNQHRDRDGDEDGNSDDCNYLPFDHELLIVEEETLVDISSEGKRTNKHPLFPIMCRLYCKVKPSVLDKFVELIQSSWKYGVQQKKIHTRGRVRSFYARCISALPPVLLKPIAQMEEDELEHERVSACISVLCKDGQSYRAMRYMLERGLWNKVFNLLEEKKGKGLEHNEMFHIALTYCLTHNDVEHCKKVWEYIPDNFGVFNLLRLIEQYLVRGKQVTGDRIPLTCDPKENLTVGIFLEMFRTMKNK